jgi:hypothetical protein
MIQYENIEFTSTTRREDVEAAVRRFARELRVVRRHAGDPPFRALARRMSFSVSTLTRALSGEKFPKWPVVEALLEACRADAATRASMKRSWCAVAEMRTPIGDELDLHLDPDPATGSVTEAAGHECDTCGALVIDEEQHERWHANYVPRGPRSLRLVHRPNNGTNTRRKTS